MNEITVYLAKIPQTLDANGALLPVAIACFVALLLLLWIVLRRARLWYWKVDAQIGAFKDMTQKLHELGEEVKETTFAVNKIGMTVKAENEKPEYAEKIFNKSKAGRVYTEEELEASIKD